MDGDRQAGVVARRALCESQTDMAARLARARCSHTSATGHPRCHESSCRVPSNASNTFVHSHQSLFDVCMELLALISDVRHFPTALPVHNTKRFNCRWLAVRYCIYTIYIVSLFERESIWTSAHWYSSLGLFIQPNRNAYCIRFCVPLY